MVLAAAEEAPFYTPVMPRSGRPFSVKMTNLGPLGWVSDRAGYRYQAMHPETGRPWPAMPDMLLSLWREVADYPHPPEACLVNLYREGAKMGLHRDEDEEDFSAPVVSVSLGDTAIFRIGGLERGGKHPDAQALLRRCGGDGRAVTASLSRHRPGACRKLDA